MPTLDRTTAAHPSAATIYLCEVARLEAMRSYRKRVR